MKNILRTFTIPVAIFLLLCNASCKKDNPETTSSTTNTNNNNPCNYTTNVIVVGGTVKNINSSSCSGNASNYTSEHYADAAHAEGITMIFDGALAPNAGSYTAINTVPVPAGKVYVEYFETTNAYQPSAGTVTVADSGSSKIFSFCNLSLTNGSSTKTISVRATCN